MADRQPRRAIHFESLSQIVTDAETITAQDHRTLGTWTSGQICEHLAKTIDVMVDATSMKTPFVIRVVGRCIRGVVLTRPMRPGMKLPAWASKHLLPEPVDLETGLEHLRSSCSRLEQQSDSMDHPIFGRLTKAQAVKLHCRHAELHLSHIVPAGKA
jgi:hypothetical protein